MKIFNYSVILLILLSFNISVNSNQQGTSEYQNKLSYINKTYKITDNPLTLPVNLNLSANNANITISKSISLNLSSVTQVSYLYMVLNTQGFRYLLYGTGEIIFNFTFEGINQILYLSFDDFNSAEGYFKQIILDYQNITLNPTSMLTINMTLNIISYLNTEYSFTLYINNIDLFLIESPLINPVVIPSWQYGEIAIYSINTLFNANVLNYITFLPTNSDINVTIIATAPIIIKNIEIDHATWVNLPNLTLPNKTFIFNFITDNNLNLQPRDLTLYYNAITNLPLQITVSAEIVIFSVINPMKTLSLDQNNILMIIALIITLIPLGNLIKNRKKKFIRVKL